MAKNEIQNRGNNPIAVLRSYLTTDSVKQRLEEILGKRAGAFGNSILNVMRNSQALQKCSPDSVMSAAMVAATMNLPIDPALGQAAIVPYKNSAQFQIMWRGAVQLCIRSGQYAAIHCSEIYKDELKSHNPITGEVEFNDPDTFKMRDAGDKKNVVGHYARFKLTTGFEKSDYMTHKQAMSHAKQYSKSYQSDLKYKKNTSAWSTDPIPMGNKTVLLRLLKGYGVMSIDMQDAFVADNSFEAAKADSDATAAKKTASTVVDTEFEEDKTPESDAPGDPAFMQDGPEEEKKESEEAEAGDEPKGDPSGFFVCQVKGCGLRFEEPRVVTKGKGKQAKTERQCPACFSKNIVNEKAFEDQA